MATPPPYKFAALPDKVLLRISAVKAPVSRTAPPFPETLLPFKVQFRSDKGDTVEIAPPAPAAVLPVKVQSTAVRLAPTDSTAMAPPFLSMLSLLEMTHRFSVSDWPDITMAPPTPYVLP